jgi:SagB-type dehydrogenase family enzyme
VTRTAWDLLRLPPRAGDDAWEIFHENSKTGRYSDVKSPSLVLRRMSEMAESLSFAAYPAVDLPSELKPLDVSLDQAIVARTSARALDAQRLTLQELATLLHYSYGVTRDNLETVYPRPFRTVPSGGALYPLELFFHTTRVAGLEPGLYHYNPSLNNVRFLSYGDRSQNICEAVVQSDLLLNASLVLFITAMFERSVFKYGDRGYRFVLLEAGHVAQNFCLVASALGLGCVTIGGFFDREIDEFLDLDGVTHSTVYMAAVGRPREQDNTESSAA